MQAFDHEAMRAVYAAAAEKHKVDSFEKPAQEVAEEVMRRVREVVQSGDSFGPSPVFVPRYSPRIAARALEILALYNCPAQSVWKHEFMCDCGEKEACTLWIEPEQFWK